jgi:DNA modification methylase
MFLVTHLFARSALYMTEPVVRSVPVGNGVVLQGDCIAALATYPEGSFQSIIADPPYFQVILDADWDNAWATEEDWLNWSVEWVRACKRVLKDDGLLFIFGQLGKREHVWLHLCSMLAREMQFHDMLIWDRVVGYNDRGDSFTPQYEMVLVLRKTKDAKVYFDKDAVRIPYDEDTIATYMRDKRYKDPVAREKHLRAGKKATNILKVPSLKGASNEKVGHPTQKPEALIDMLVRASSRPGDLVLDPFLGSGTTAAVAESLNRPWVGVELFSDYVDMSVTRLTVLAETKQPPAI